MAGGDTIQSISNFQYRRHGEKDDLGRRDYTFGMSEIRKFGIGDEQKKPEWEKETGKYVVRGSGLPKHHSVHFSLLSLA